jgi:hypothetical protein
MNQETVKAIDLMANKFPTGAYITATVNNLSQGELLDAAISVAQVAEGLAKYASKGVLGINVVALGNDFVKILSSCQVPDDCVAFL